MHQIHTAERWYTYALLCFYSPSDTLPQTLQMTMKLNGFETILRKA